MIPLRKIAVVLPVITVKSTLCSVSVQAQKLAKRKKPVQYAIARNMKQNNYDDGASASNRPSNPSRAARDGAYARTAMPKFSGGGGGSASTTRSMS